MILFEYNKNKGLGILKTEHLSEIREHFSTPNEGARFARMRGRFIPSRTYAITPTGQFDPCLFYEIIKFLVKNEYCQQSDIKTSSEFASHVIPSHIYKNNISFTNTPYDNMSLKLRDYQKEIVYQCLDKGRGVTVLATAGGKTLVMASLLSNFFMLNNQFKCLLIVPDLGLVNQTFNDFAQYGVPFFFNKWTGSDKLNANANVVIANLGIILSEKSDLSWLEGINVLIFDEIHKARRGNQINKILKQLNTPIRFGFTGTMPEDKLDQWNIIGKIGPIIYEKSSFELRKENFVTSVICNILEISYNDKPKYVETLNPTERYRTELEFLFENKFRNNLMCTLANNATNNVLILVDYIKHGEAIYKYLSEHATRKKIFFIQGSVEVEDREQIKGLMEKESNVVAIAISKIFSTGINVKNLHYIFFAAGGKAKVKVIQSIGRGLRLHENKSKLQIFDFADQLTYGRRHEIKRQTLYDQETIPYKITEIREK